MFVVEILKLLLINIIASFFIWNTFCFIWQNELCFYRHSGNGLLRCWDRFLSCLPVGNEQNVFAFFPLKIHQGPELSVNEHGNFNCFRRNRTIRLQSSFKLIKIVSLLTEPNGQIQGYPIVFKLLPGNDLIPFESKQRFT